MQLPRDGQEYATLTFTVLPTGVTVEASVDNRKTWTATISGASDLQRKILLRGPASTQTAGILVPESATLWIRVPDNPEVVVRSAGVVTLI